MTDEQELTAEELDAHKGDDLSDKLLPCELHKSLEYNPETGVLVWKQRSGKGGTRWAGKEAGAADTKGRLRVEINSKSYSASHICFAMYYDRWPLNQIDHINRNKLDNRIQNLREATNAENSRNRKRLTTGYKGVTLHKGRYIARIGINYEIINLGSFDTPIEASEAYQAAAIKYHGEFACPK